MEDKKLTKQEEESLKEANLITEMVSCPGWAVFQRFLEQKIKNSWLDPRLCKSKEELAYQYTIAWGSAKAAEEILEFVDTMRDTQQALVAKAQGKVIDKYAIGKR
jgi:hypothetical protein